MAERCKLKEVQPTLFLEDTGHGLRQMVRVTVASLEPVDRVTLVAAGAEVSLGILPAGESTHEVYVDELSAPAQIEFILKLAGSEVDRKQVRMSPPVRWTVHVVHLSHHDVGYTDLPSNVLPEHDGFLDSAIDMAEATAGFPDDSQFRVTVEQAWSIDHFLRSAPPARAARMIELMRSGHVELTALFGNMTTELCGPEALARCAYHAFRIGREHGVPILSAEHNDVPGFTWGLSEVLVRAGVKLFCPRLPYYYNWGHTDLQGFWDEDALFRHRGPGAFWWESPSGERILLYFYRGLTGGCHADLGSLVGTLRQLSDWQYPYRTIRWLVGGGARDNSPYIDGFAHTVKKWNSRWAYPHLISSTNARFYQDFVREVPEDLPVHRGGLPGQDYPVGATSTAAATAVNRNNHCALPAAETLASAAATATDYRYQGPALARAYEDVLWHDEHTWGHHFPCGPACAASEAEKAVHAYCAAAEAHDVASRAMARVADQVQCGEGFHLVVFNTLSWARTAPASVPMREIENCGSTMCRVPPEDDKTGPGFLKGVPLTDRWHAYPPQEILDGRFALVDLTTGEEAPFQIVEIESAADTVPHAAQRLGLGSGTARYGFFENPKGVRLDLRFVARDVPAVGYRTYRLVPREPARAAKGPLKATRTTLENEFYRIEVDPKTGAVAAIKDSRGRQLVDTRARHPFGSLVVRSPEGEQSCGLTRVRVRRGESGPVRASIEIDGAAPGHPAVRQSIALWAGQRRIEFAARVLKDPTPLLDAHIAFPFRVTKPRFRYEGGLSVMDPVDDYLPGAYSDRIAVQNWVKVAGGGRSILWSSLDAPIVSLGGLWRGYVSPAHSCVVPGRYAHPPLEAKDLKRGWIYSDVFANNFGTNFSVSQVGDVLLRYVIVPVDGELDDAGAARLGWESVTPLQHMFTSQERDGRLPVADSFAAVEGDEVVLLTWKAAEDGAGYVLRLWNPAGRDAQAAVWLPHVAVKSVRRATLTEEDTGEIVPHTDDGFRIDVAAGAVATVRVTA